MWGWEVGGGGWGVGGGGWTVFFLFLFLFLVAIGSVAIRRGIAIVFVEGCSSPQFLRPAGVGCGGFTHTQTHTHRERGIAIVLVEGCGSPQFLRPEVAGCVLKRVSCFVFESFVFRVSYFVFRV